MDLVKDPKTFSAGTCGGYDGDVRAAVLIAVAVALGAATTSAAVATSGVHGIVTRGPITPVCQTGEPCDGPAAGVTLAFLRAGVEAARVRTNDAGGYRIRLAPGVYVVRIRPASKIGKLSPTRVRVVAGRMRRVDFAIDTGIR